MREMFKQSVEKCFEYLKNHTRFDLEGKKYIIDANLWNNKFFLYEIIKMDSNQGIIEDKKIMESLKMEDIAKYLWKIAGINI